MASRERKQFLLAMYSACWNNISRADESSWKMMVAYSALIASLAFSSPVIGYFGFLIIFVPFSSLSVAVSLNANLWFLRNIGMISNLEREFLRKSDYDRLIPKKWQEKVHFVNTELWWVFVLVYSALGTFITLLFYPKLNQIEQCLTIFLSIAVISLTSYYWRRMHKRHTSFVKAAPGKS